VVLSLQLICAGIQDQHLWSQVDCQPFEASDAEGPLTKGVAEEVVQGVVGEVDKGPAEEDEEEENPDIYFKRKRKPFSSRELPRKKQAVSKLPRRARKVFSAGEEELAAYVPCLLLIL